MAETAYQTQYLSEFIAGFEQRTSLLRSAVSTEVVTKGNTVTWLVADSGGATAVTRGVNGLIPARADNLVQTSATLVEWHDLVRKTGFNVFASQGDQRRIMQETTMSVINRKIDTDIIAQLDTATVDTGAAVTASVAGIAKALAILGAAEVPLDDNIFGVITPGMYGYMMQMPEFTSKDYIDSSPFGGTTRKYLRWFGVNWIVHPNLTGQGTSSAKSYIFHRSAIGHAVNSGGIMAKIGYDEEQDYSYARTSIYMATKLLQNAGIVQILHDDSAMVGT